MVKLIVYLKIFLGSFFLIFGLLFIYKPSAAGKTIKVIKETFLNETYFLLKNKRFGFLFLLLGMLLLYMGLSRLQNF